MATINNQFGQQLQGYTLEQVLLDVLYMAKNLELASQFVSGERTRLTINSSNGTMTFTGSIETATSFDANGNLLTTAIPYLTSTAQAPAGQFYMPPSA